MHINLYIKNIKHNYKEMLISFMTSSPNIKTVKIKHNKIKEKIKTKKIKI
jgi:hypothetical protein